VVVEQLLVLEDRGGPGDDASLQNGYWVRFSADGLHYQDARDELGRCRRIVCCGTPGSVSRGCQAIG